MSSDPSFKVVPPQASEQRDRLYDLLSDQGREHADLLRDVGTKLDKLTDACAAMSGELKGLAVTPALIRTLTIGMLVGIVIVGIAAGAQVAVSTGFFTASSQPAVAPALPVPPVLAPAAAHLDGDLDRVVGTLPPPK